jgi:aldehyde dehydrogenase (NAD(P)+)
MVAQPQKGPIPPSDRATLDEALATLRKNADRFARTSIGERLDLLRQMLDGYLEVAEPAVNAVLRMKGVDPSSPAAAEEWFAGPTIVVRNLRILIQSLGLIRRGLPTIDPGQVRSSSDGRTVVDVFPASPLDKVLFSGFTAEVWMKPGVLRSDALSRLGAHYKVPVSARKGGVALVLGAGNVSSIPPTDVMYKMFVEGKVCLLKMNPVNEVAGPFIERAFRCLIDRGFLHVAYGGADVGKYLVEHDEVDEVHITGSDKTHDLMVWGPPGPEREARKANKQPLLGKTITSELGNVSPVIVVPGPYSDDELAFQGENICAAIANNASFNCNSAKLMVQARGWPGRDKLLASLGRALSSTPVRQAYYPGAEDRWKLLVESHPKAQRFGEARPGTLPWALIPDVDSNDTSDKVFSMEPWCGVISETTLGTADPAAFLDEAVRFCNESVWGTLSATIIIHPKSLKDPKVKDALERAIRNLRYGTVAINHWPALGYAFITPPWGGHPSSTLEDIQSGKGWVHNAFLLNDDDIEKVVVRGPLTVKPKPPWFASHKTAHEMAPRLLAMEGAPSWLKLPPIILRALKG